MVTVHDLSCIVHVHSTYSDGTATVPEILAAARAAGAGCVLLTDHDTLQARRDGWEGRHDGVLLVVGHEITAPVGHLLAFGLDREVDHRGRGAAELCAEVQARGGLAIAAHPFSEGSRMSRRIGRPHPWEALEACPAVELWSMATDAAESWRGPREAAVALRRPEAIEGPPRDHLRRWDELCRTRRTVAVGGLDAHQPGVRLRGRVRSPMPHARWFRLLRTHVLVDTYEPGPEAVLEALREGRCLLAARHLGDPTGFRFAGGDGVAMGGEAPYAGQRLTVAAPRPAELVLLRDGEPVAAVSGTRLEHRASGPGVYRVEARLDGRTWVVTNPVYLR